MRQKMPYDEQRIRQCERRGFPSSFMLYMTIYEL